MQIGSCQIDRLLADWDCRLCDYDRYRVLSGDGTIDQLGALARSWDSRGRCSWPMPGLVKAGHLEHAHASLEAAGVEALEFSDFGPNPDADMLEAGRRSCGRQAHRFDHRPRRRQLARLRERHQLSAHAGRTRSTTFRATARRRSRCCR